MYVVLVTTSVEQIKITWKRIVGYSRWTITADCDKTLKGKMTSNLSSRVPWIQMISQDYQPWTPFHSLPGIIEISIQNKRTIREQKKTNSYANSSIYILYTVELFTKTNNYANRSIFILYTVQLFVCILNKAGEWLLVAAFTTLQISIPQACLTWYPKILHLHWKLIDCCRILILPLEWK